MEGPSGGGAVAARRDRARRRGRDGHHRKDGPRDRARLATDRDGHPGGPRLRSRPRGFRPEGGRLPIPRSMGWLVVTAVVVLSLVALSWFALDRPNVVWSDVKPHCPHCRSVVPDYSKRCPVCREEFDWTPSPDEASPACGI